ncbi:hypothetical protein MtrunA17_Chr1g0210421 [Medicago truncatula]|uniref:Uncharacterized protein n=1 Tax=Medicago truncatula TaxID=3880 RepID=A0A396K3M4_MEDTR|nr:hypothetical protein MtrunA17_Chr1g0210421 [Medicago truncatula]
MSTKSVACGGEKRKCVCLLLDLFQRKRESGFGLEWKRNRTCIRIEMNLDYFVGLIFGQFWDFN